MRPAATLRCPFAVSLVRAHVSFESAIGVVGTAIDAAGVAMIVIGILGGSVLFGFRSIRERDLRRTYVNYRQNIGRAILLGLELLVAGDIIRTVAISPTFASVGVLGLIVLVRTFLSFSLEVELEGRWPWQQPARSGSSAESNQQ
jgi:uncharacterized membrane protein